MKVVYEFNSEEDLYSLNIFKQSDELYNFAFEIIYNLPKQIINGIEDGRLKTAEDALEFIQEHIREESQSLIIN